MHPNLNGDTSVDAFTQPTVQPKKSVFSGLSVDDVSREETDVMRRSSYHYDRKKLNRVGKRTQAESEYTAVMSPIFGNTADESKDYKKVHNAIELEKVDSDDDYATVLSPMYGTEFAGSLKATRIPQKTVNANQDVELPEVIELNDVLAKKNKTEKKENTLFESESKVK